MSYFEYERTAEKAGIPDDVLASWHAGLEREYHGDMLLVELRLLRACNTIAAGSASLSDVVAAFESEFAEASVKH